MLNRMLGVLKLDVFTFEEVEADTQATSQAVIIVLITALVAGIGSGFGASFTGNSFLGNFITTLIGAFVGWLLWSVVSFFVGTALFGGQADLGQMLRVVGFAYTPQLLGIIPCIGGVIGVIWSLIAGFIAIRQGLDLDNIKAFLTVVVGFIAYFIVMAMLNQVFGSIGI
jgi:hypothetical protein